MCPGPENEAPERNYVWNLTNVGVRQSCETVEFRGVGMSGSIDEVEKWAAFAVGLERGPNLAVGNSYDWYADTNPTQRDLLDLIRGGILPPASRSLRRFERHSQFGGNRWLLLQATHFKSVNEGGESEIGTRGYIIKLKVSFSLTEIKTEDDEESKVAKLIICLA